MPEPETCFLIYRWHSWGYGGCRKYRSASGGWTEIPAKAWWTPSRAAAEEIAGPLGSIVEERYLNAAVAKFGEPQTSAVGRAVHRTRRTR